MLTPDAGGPIRLNLTQLAQLKGVTKQAISQRLERFEAEGLIEVRRGRRNEKTVALAEWDSVTGEYTDPARLVARATVGATRQGDDGADGVGLEDQVARSLGGDGAKADPTYTQALTRKAQYEADLKQEQLKRLRADVLPVDQVKSAIERCAEAIVRDLEQLPTFADDLAAALARGGTAALRDALKAKARELRERLERSVGELDREDDEDFEDLAA